FVRCHTPSRPQTGADNLHVGVSNRVTVHTKCSDKQRAESRQYDSRVTRYALTLGGGITSCKGLNCVRAVPHTRKTSHPVFVCQSPKRQLICALHEHGRLP